MKKTALIMAGGMGERFWPKSRKNLPKQFLSLTDGGKTLIQLTVERILPLVEMNDVYVVTNRDYRKLVREQIPDLPEENILCEFVGKNTAPCVGWGAVHIKKKYGDAMMFVLPSDHLIKYSSMFIKTLREAAEIAVQKNNLVTIGITPYYPETGYGYIKFKHEENVGEGFAVEKFVEKPDTDTANEYLETEQYLWNSGIFVWKVSSILNNIKQLMPDTFNGLKKIHDAIGTYYEMDVTEKEFELFQSESIDYGVMEKAKGIFVIPGSFGWNDLGGWPAVRRINKCNEFGNSIEGKVVAIDTKDSIIHGSNKLIATVGLENTIVVDTEDAILICNENHAGDIKKVLEMLRNGNMNEYL